MSLKACAAESVWRRSLAAGAMFWQRIAWLVEKFAWFVVAKQPVHICGVDMWSFSSRFVIQPPNTQVYILVTAMLSGVLPTERRRWRILQPAMSWSMITSPRQSIQQTCHDQFPPVPWTAAEGRYHGLICDDICWYGLHSRDVVDDSRCKISGRKIGKLILLALFLARHSE